MQVPAKHLSADLLPLLSFSQEVVLIERSVAFPSNPGDIGEYGMVVEFIFQSEHHSADPSTMIPSDCEQAVTLTASFCCKKNNVV